MNIFQRNKYFRSQEFAEILINADRYCDENFVGVKMPTKLNPDVIRRYALSNTSDIRYSLKEPDEKDEPKEDSAVQEHTQKARQISLFDNGVITIDESKPSFSAMLLQLVTKTGEKDSVIYKAAGIDRRLYSKMISSNDYRPSKQSVVSLGLALKLGIDEFNEFLASAGFVLSRSIRRDIIIEYCIKRKIYDLIIVDQILDQLGEQPISRY